MKAPKGLSKAAKLGYLETDPKKLKAAGFAPPGLGEKLASAPIKAALNAPKEAAEIAITTPTTIAHDLAVMGEGFNQLKQGHPEKFAEAAKKTWVDPAVAQAKEIKKDPVGYAVKHPVTTALTVLPAGRAASLGAGRVARSGAAAKVAKKTKLPVHQPPERPPARLRGTTLKQVRPVKRGVVGRGREIRRDRRQGAPQITTDRTMRDPIPELDRRVDEFYDLAKLREQAGVGSKARKLNEQIKAERKKHKRNKGKKAEQREAPATVRLRDEPTAAELKALEKTPEQRTPKEAAAVKVFEARGRDVEVPTTRSVRVPAVRKATRERRKNEKAVHAKWAQETLSGARGGAAQATKRDFARDFGSHWEVIEGVGGKPAVRKFTPADKPEGSGKIHASREDAQKVADALKTDKTITWEPSIMKIEGKTEGSTSGYAVVPKQALERFERHGRVGQGGYLVGPGLRVTSRTFRKAVLPTSTKWLGGQIVEGAVRSMAHGGSPLPVIRYKRGRRYVKAIERTVTQDALKAGYNKNTAEQLGKRAADQVRHQAISSGQFNVTGPAADYARHGEDAGRTLASEFHGTGSMFEPYAKGATALAGKPGIRHVRGGYRRFASVVFNDINGTIERYYKTGMLGKEVKKQSPLLENKLLGLSEKALDEAARGHRGTAAQTNLARGVMRAYGKYSQFEPAMRDTILHSTPFVPWMLNMTKFLGQVMPLDHPLKTSLLAAHVQADQEWRKANGLSLYSDKKVPDWLIGSVPSGKGKYIPVGRFGPFAPGDPIGAIGNQYLPQLLGMYENTQGRDWKGDAIPGGAGRRISNTLLTGRRVDDPVGRPGRAPDRAGEPGPRQEGQADRDRRNQEGRQGGAGLPEPAAQDRDAEGALEQEEAEGQGWVRRRLDLVGRLRQRRAQVDGLPSRRPPQGPQVRAGPEGLRAPDPAGVRLPSRTSAHRPGRRGSRRSCPPPRAAGASTRTTQAGARCRGEEHGQLRAQVRRL